MSVPASSEFVAEAREHLSLICDQLLQLERPSTEDRLDRLQAILRSAHSIKGGAGFFGLPATARLFHAFEAALESLLEQHLFPETTAIDVFLETVDCGANLIEDLERNPEARVDALVNRLEALGQPARSESPHTAPVDIPEVGAVPPERQDLHSYSVELDFLACEAQGAGPLEVVDRLGQFAIIDQGRIRMTDREFSVPLRGELAWECQLQSRYTPSDLEAKLQLPIKVTSSPRSLVPSADSIIRPADDSETATSPHESRPADRQQSIRIPVGLADRLVNLAGELVLVRNRARRLAENLQPLSPSIVQRFDQVTSEIQATVLQTRMQPVAQLFQKFPRFVRDLGRQLGKRIHLEVLGAETELDKSILDALSDPLMHLVRNACDHGLETSAERIAGHKAAEGRIWLSARHVGDRICIEIRDDGRGIDRAAVARKAVERGLQTTGEVTRMDDRSLLGLIFLPGFSTAASVTDLSGRGVGLDVVHTNVSQLGGTVEIESEQGRGTTVRLYLSLTLAIIPSLLAEIAGQRFAIPQRDVGELVRVGVEGAQAQIDFLKDQQVLRLRGRLLPLVRWPDPVEVSGDEPSIERESAPGTLIVVLRTGDKRFGLVVDSVFASEEIVVKPFHRCLRHLETYSGATILGDGRVALILNPEGVARATRAIFTTDSISSQDVVVAQQPTTDVLVVRTLAAGRAAVPLRDVRKVVKLDCRHLEPLKSGWYVSIEGRPTLVRALGVEEPLSPTAGCVHALLPRASTGIVAIVAEVLGVAPVRVDAMHSLATEGDQHHVVMLPEGITPMWNLEGTTTILRNHGAGARILVVDDTRFFRETVANCLRDDGFDVTTAENGMEALEWLRREPFDAVVSDVEMPGMDGLEFAAAVRTSEAWRSLPLLALTTLTGPDIHERALQHGFNAFQVKLDPTALRSTLRQMLAHPRKSDEVKCG